MTYRDEIRDYLGVSRRKLLFAGGGLLVTGTIAALGFADPTHHPQAAMAADGPRHYPHPAGPPGASRPKGDKATEAPHWRVPPAEPVHYIGDGPMTIALTIDDGPSPVYTPQILQLLEQYGITASFSMIGTNVTAYPSVAQEVAAAGHVIVNHTWDHADLSQLQPSAVLDEITRGADAIHGATGAHPRILRAPYGAWSPTVLEYCAETRTTPLDWSVDPRDWALPGVKRIVKIIMTNTQTGSIILEHDGGGNRSQTVAALGIVIPRLLRAGYRFHAP